MKTGKSGFHGADLIFLTEFSLARFLGAHHPLLISVSREPTMVVVAERAR